MLKKYLLKPFPLFLILSILVFWPFSLGIFSLKNDALTYYYPIRTLISDALNNGELPLWTPFINMGYPLHADMQAGAWNPVIWIFAFLSNYSLVAFHVEFLFYITFAGLGFYMLCKDLGCSKPVAFAIAIAYQFSGFMIDSAQFFTCISAACYIPYVFLFFRRIMLQQQLKDAYLFALFLFLLFTGGYPSLFIILCYALLTYGIFTFFTSAEKKSLLKKLFLPLSIACLFFILLSLPAIISFYQQLAYIDRGKSQTLAFVLENPMNPATTLSLLTPFGTTANNTWLFSSILMRSIYIGIIPLIFLVYAGFNKTLRKNKELVFFIFCAVTMLGFAWGEFFFLRKLAYYVLPLMNSFRHPALFRFFTIFFFLLTAALSLNSWNINHEKNIPALKRICLSLLGIALVTGILSLLFLHNFPTLESIKNIAPKDLLMNLNFQGRYLIQFPFLLGIILLSFYAIVKKKSIYMICMILIADMFFATQLNMPVTVYGAKSFRTIERLINRNPEKFPLPNHKSIAENSLNSFDPEFVAGSRLPFTKKIGRNDYFISPGNLSRQDEFYESAIKDSIFNFPVLYFADSTGSIQVTQFSANHLYAMTNNRTAGSLNYLQNNYYGWKAFIDGKQTNITTSNICFMSVKVPEGTHMIQFRYRPEIIIIAWEVSMISFVLMTLLYLFHFFPTTLTTKHQKEKKYT